MLNTKSNIKRDFIHKNISTFLNYFLNLENSKQSLCNHEIVYQLILKDIEVDTEDLKLLVENNKKINHSLARSCFSEINLKSKLTPIMSAFRFPQAFSMNNLQNKKIEYKDSIEEKESESASQSNSEIVLDISELKMIEKEISKDHYVIEFTNKRESDCTLEKGACNEKQNIQADENSITLKTSRKRNFFIITLTIVVIITFAILTCLKLLKLGSFFK